MKNTLFLGLMIFVLVFGFSGCDPGNGGKINYTVFEGTWTGTDGNALTYSIKIIFDKNNYEWIYPGQASQKGTFIITETELQMNKTHTWKNNQWNIEPDVILWRYELIDNKTFKIISSDGNTKDSIVGTYTRE